MAEIYTYQRKRRELGRPVQFQDSEVKLCGYLPQKEFKDEQERIQAQQQYVPRDPNFIQLDNISELSKHSVNTERVKVGERGMYHKEGGWPSNVDPTEAQETNKYKKKIEKDPAFGVATKEMLGAVDKCVKQNNQIDMFEEYFENESSEHVVENITTKTIMLFKDHSETVRRAVSKITWNPEHSDKLAAGYSIMRFQQMPDKMDCRAFIWNTNNPNQYDQQLNAPSPVTCIQYNNKQVDTIGAGCYNGLVQIWDLRKGQNPVSHVEVSHYDPVTQFQWTNHRLGVEFVTTSTDGRCIWWDLRNLSQPLDTMNITDEGSDTLIGGTTIEYNAEAAANKYLIGTETGQIYTALKKTKGKIDIVSRHGREQGQHLGPIYSIHRNPQNSKYFLSVGDWSAKVWVDDIKQPLIRTCYHKNYLADGCWSPSRVGCFFLARRDGWLDVWDYYYRQNEVAFSHKVSDAPLTCLKLNTHPLAQGSHSQAAHNGKLLAVGDQNGTVTILELCDSLYQPQLREKEILSETFEREIMKEKQLENIKKQQDLVKRQAPKDHTAAREKFEARKAELIKDVEDKFASMLKEHEKQKEDENLQELDSPNSRNNQNRNANLEGEGEGEGEGEENEGEDNEGEQQDENQQNGQQNGEQGQNGDLEQSNGQQQQ